MKRKEAQSKYDLYYFYLSEADNLEAHGDKESAETLHDRALDLEREIEEAGYLLSEFK